ncbi:LysM peptidoglycan-binding domain-containing protein [Candidatus Woesearchaeota archaeon]|nr:LysM peptidoglycan-binding domain-containing protein [Candidatus Woesearchaeota archaeon]
MTGHDLGDLAEAALQMPVNRRRVLGLLGLGALAVALSGCAGTSINPTLGEPKDNEGEHLLMDEVIGFNGRITEKGEWNHPKENGGHQYYFKAKGNGYYFQTAVDKKVWDAHHVDEKVHITGKYHSTPQAGTNDSPFNIRDTTLSIPWSNNYDNPQNLGPFTYQSGHAFNHTWSYRIKNGDTLSAIAQDFNIRDIEHHHPVLRLPLGEIITQKTTDYFWLKKGDRFIPAHAQRLQPGEMLYLIIPR